jgi:hypothetical protein
LPWAALSARRPDDLFAGCTRPDDPDFDQVQPRTRGRGEVHADGGLRSAPPRRTRCPDALEHPGRPVCLTIPVVTAASRSPPRRHRSQAAGLSGPDYPTRRSHRTQTRLRHWISVGAGHLDPARDLSLGQPVGGQQHDPRCASPASTVGDSPGPQVSTHHHSTRGATTDTHQLSRNHTVKSLLTRER